MTGYVSYSSHNKLYEDAVDKLLSLDNGLMDAEESFQEYVKNSCINGGFVISVKGFPNRPKHTFIQRGGSEDKNRTFMIYDFDDPYRPDYGRKNYANVVHALLLEMEKQIMLTIRPIKRNYIIKPNTAATHGVVGLAEAKQLLKDDEANLRNQYSKAIEENSDLADSKPVYELDVMLEFLVYVNSGVLKGFKVLGCPTGIMLDGLFDYEIERSEITEYSPSAPLGIRFGSASKKYGGKWLEYKVHADSLITDLKRNPGEPGKKWFETIDLLVCFDVDGEIEDYSIEEVVEDNIDALTYFGVTHLLRNGSSEHVIQVISIKKLRHILASPTTVE